MAAERVDDGAVRVVEAPGMGAREGSHRLLSWGRFCLTPTGVMTAGVLGGGGVVAEGKWGRARGR